MSEYIDTRTPEEKAEDEKITKANIKWWDDHYIARAEGAQFPCYCPGQEKQPHDWHPDPCPAGEGWLAPETPDGDRPQCWCDYGEATVPHPWHPEDECEYHFAVGKPKPATDEERLKERIRQRDIRRRNDRFQCDYDNHLNRIAWAAREYREVEDIFDAESVEVKDARVKLDKAIAGMDEWQRGLRGNPL